jgi:hypothetical protein
MMIKCQYDKHTEVSDTPQLLVVSNKLKTQGLQALREPKGFRMGESNPRLPRTHYMDATVMLALIQQYITAR